MSTDDRATAGGQAPTIGEVLKALAPGRFETLCKVTPAGSLQVRKDKAQSISFFWRYSIGSKSERVPIGLYGPMVPPKSLKPIDGRYSFEAAKRAAEVLAEQHYHHRDEGGRPALLAAQQKAQRDADEAKAAAAKHTLRALLTDYCDYLEAQEKGHKTPRSLFRIHIFEEWPQLANAPASALTTEEVVDILRKCGTEKGHDRTSNNLRAYMRAAYAVAISSRTSGKVPERFKAYKISSNPVASTVPDAAANRADKNPLSPSQMREYWKAVKHAPGLKGALLRLHVLTGGQRIAQLVQLETTKIDWTERTIVIIDRKGRQAIPRPHVVPLVPQAEKALREFKPEGRWAISTDGGKTHVYPTTLTNWAAEAAATIVDADGKPKIPDFEAKRIRSGVETLLASLDVDEKLRGRLQSHGVSGVQSRHYDAWGYLPQKRRLLETLFDALEHPMRTNVTPIKQKRRA